MWAFVAKFSKRAFCVGRLRGKTRKFLCGLLWLTKQASLERLLGAKRVRAGFCNTKQLELSVFG